MTNLRKYALAAGMSGLILSLGAVPSFAQGADEVAKRLKSVFEKQGMSLDFASVKENGDDIVLGGVRVGAVGQAAKVDVGEVLLSDVEEDDGEYTIGKLSVPFYNFKEGSSALSIEGVEIAGLNLPEGESADPLAGVMMYESADLKMVSVKMADAEVFSLHGLHIDVSRPDDDKGAYEFSGSAEKFSTDLSTVKDPKTREIAGAMGYSKINGYLEMEGSWAPSDGRMAVDKYDIAIEDAGTLGLTFDMTGYTPSFIAALRDMQAKMAKDGTNDQAAGIAMLGLMQQLNFRAASVRFDDDSLTGKVLEFLAKQQGVKPADIANQAKAILPFALMQLNNPAFAQNVADAVNKFLDNPKSLEITAEPGSPVPVAMIAASAMSAPQSLPEQLGVKVKANQ